MNDYLLAAILGVVEGLTEFLPVSSTAHIRLTQAALVGTESLTNPFWKLFAVAIQLPAILAVVVYFRTRIVEFAKSFLSPGLTLKQRLLHPVSLVVIASIMTVIPAILAKKLIKGNLESLWVMGGALVIGGVIMWIVDAIFGKRGVNPEPLSPVDPPTSDKPLNDEPVHTPGITSSMEQMKPWQAAWIGAVQVLAAIFPGTSRSMATIAAGQVAGLTRTTALEFSFFLSIPIMIAAFAKDMRDSLTPGDAGYVGQGLTREQMLQIGIGSVVSFLVAWVVIAWFMAWVKRRGFVPFAIYRIIIGTAVLVWASRAA